jgi:hypothetical protein
MFLALMKKVDLDPGTDLFYVYYNSCLNITLILGNVSFSYNLNRNTLTSNPNPDQTTPISGVWFGPFPNLPGYLIINLPSSFSSSVADPGCLYRIRLFYIPDPGSELTPSRIHIKEFK